MPCQAGQKKGSDPLQLEWQTVVDYYQVGAGNQPQGFWISTIAVLLTIEPSSPLLLLLLNLLFIQWVSLGLFTGEWVRYQCLQHLRHAPELCPFSNSQGELGPWAPAAFIYKGISEPILCRWSQLLCDPQLCHTWKSGVHPGFFYLLHSYISIPSSLIEPWAFGGDVQSHVKFQGRCFLDSLA